MATIQVGRIGLASALLAASVGLLAQPRAAWAEVAASTGMARFVPLTPRRVLDTRTGLGTAGAIPDDGTITLQLAGLGGLPSSGAVAVAFNLTATNATAPGFVTAWPSGTSRPAVSNLNVETEGQSIANFAVVRLGADSAVSFYAHKKLDLIADLAGYWVSAEISTGGRYQPAGPQRILDTRTGLGVAAPGAVPAGFAVALQVAGRGGVPVSGASSVILNVTATNSKAPGFVTVWPAGHARPLASSLNVDQDGQTIANLAVVPLGAGGQISVFASSEVDLLADVLGYFTDDTVPTGDQGLFVPLDPVRMIDTRLVAQDGGLYTPKSLVGGYRADLQIAGHGGVPAAGVAAVIGNVTATETLAPGFITVYPAATALPLASNVNIDRAGQTIPNLAIGRLGYQGRLSLFSYAGSDVAFDVAGWFTGVPAPPTPGTPLDPPPATADVDCGFGAFRAGSWPTSCWRPYGNHSPFNRLAPPDPKLVPNSEAIVDRVLGMGPIADLVVAPDTSSDWYHPVYYSAPTDPLFTVHCTGVWDGCEVEGMQIRIPDSARPAAGGDAHLAVVDQAGGWEYDLWHVHDKPVGGGVLSVEWGGRTEIKGDGLESDATAAHFGLLAGAIRAQEMAAGRIDHALFMMVGCTSSQYVYPARGLAASCADEANAPAAGQYFWLEMTDSEIDALEVPSWKKTILHALSRYGAFVGDTGGNEAFTFQFESGSTYTSFGAGDAMAAFARSQTAGVTEWDGKYYFDLGSDVDWRNRLRVLDPCVAERTCGQPAPLNHALRSVRPT